MTIGIDIRGAIEEVGNSFTILRDSGNMSGEYLDYENNAQVTKPFIREFFLEATLDYETELVVGDVLELDTTGDRFILMNKTPESFENTVIDYQGVLYKCNVSGEILRQSGEVRDPNTYLKSPVFETIKTDAYALHTEPLYSGDLETETELGQLDIRREELYIPSSFGIQVLDRFQSTSGEYFVVESIKKRRFAGVDVCVLGEDTR